MTVKGMFSFFLYKHTLFVHWNNPAKKPLVERRKYEEISNWEDGCPDCPAKPTTYAAFRNHRYRGCGPGAKIICQDCGKEVAKSNTTHLKNCPNKK